jgi:UDP-N-acetylmuramoyl-L-alanyl-D-glutamate--2,6-diaminopimelate ligase
MRKIYHFLLAFFGNVVYGQPSRRLVVIGVTGTKGKSSTLELLNAVMESAGERTALLSSVKRRIVGVETEKTSDNTMPGRFFIQRFLRDAVRAGAGYAFVEVTSQGIVQWRDRFIDWDAAFFMNLSPEHIESHGSFENYRAAKVRFFQDVLRSHKKLRQFFVNAEDENKDYFIRIVESAPDAEVFSFDKQYFIREAESWGWNLKTVSGRREIADWLMPDFNILNAAAVLRFATARGVPSAAIQKAFREFAGTPGRFDLVVKEPFAAIVDYAHTPDSLEKIYSAARNSFAGESGGRLICVLGSAGGGRDKWKRKIMGGIAAKFCDEVVLTDEDPYDENPEAIVSEIEAGFLQIPNSKFQISKNYWKILDRREALRKALYEALPGDVVVATGKGSEPSIHVAKGKTVPWDEREIVKELVAERFVNERSGV